MRYPGTEYKTTEKLKVSGTIHFNTAYSEMFEFLLPKNEKFKLSIWTNPEDLNCQIWLSNPEKYEKEIVKGLINIEVYDSYSLILTNEQFEKYTESLVDFSNAIYFYSVHEKFGEFSNFSEYGIEYESEYFATIEHFYQSQKFEDLEYSNRIKNCETPKLASILGKSREYRIKENWDDIKNELMYFAVREKFEKNKELKKLLLSTNNSLLIENSPYDYYWGIGKNGTGKNQLGVILMRVREILKATHNTG